MKRPDSFVTTLSAVLRSTLVIVTVTPGSTPPVRVIYGATDTPVDSLGNGGRRCESEKKQT